MHCGHLTESTDELHTVQRAYDLQMGVNTNTSGLSEGLRLQQQLQQSIVVTTGLVTVYKGFSPSQKGTERESLILLVHDGYPRLFFSFVKIQVIKNDLELLLVSSGTHEPTSTGCSALCRNVRNMSLPCRTLEKTVAVWNISKDSPGAHSPVKQSCNVPFAFFFPLFPTSLNLFSFSLVGYQRLIQW